MDWLAFLTPDTVVPRLGQLIIVYYTYMIMKPIVLLEAYSGLREERRRCST